MVKQRVDRTPQKKARGRSRNRERLQLQQHEPPITRVYEPPFTTAELRTWNTYCNGCNAFLANYTMAAITRSNLLRERARAAGAKPSPHARHPEMSTPQPHRLFEHEGTVTADTQCDSDSYSDMPELVRLNDPYYHYRTGANRSRASGTIAQTMSHPRAETDTSIPVAAHRFAEHKVTSTPLQGVSVVDPNPNPNYYRPGANRSRVPATTAQTVPYPRAEHTDTSNPVVPHRFAELDTDNPDLDSDTDNLADVPQWMLNPVDERYQRATAAIRRRIGRRQSITLLTIDGYSSHI